jgi:predicted esterase
LIGMSAGGHLVSLAGTLGDGPDPRTGGWEKHPSDFRAVISVSAPYELEKLSWGKIWTPVGGDPAAARQLASLIIHSDNDGSVPIQQALDMVQALEKAKAKHRFSLYQKRGHMTVNQEVVKEALAFIAEITK